MIDGWCRFWFAPSAPAALGACRIVFFLGTALLMGRVDFGAFCDVSRTFWTRGGVFRLPGLDLPSARGVRLLQRAWTLSLVLAGLGVLTPVAMGAAFVLGYYLNAIRTRFYVATKLQQIQQFPVAPMVLVLGGFALSHAGAALSIDALLRGTSPPPPSGEFTWPIRFGQIALCFMFCAAGITKLLVSGWRWAWSDNLARMLTQREGGAIEGLVDGYLPILRGVAAPLSRWRRLCRLSAVGVLVVELAYPLSLWHPVARALLVPAGIGLILGFIFVMGVRRMGIGLVLQVFWVPWDRVLPWLGRRG